MEYRAGQIWRHRRSGLRMKIVQADDPRGLWVVYPDHASRGGDPRRLYSRGDFDRLHELVSDRGAAA